MHFHHVGEGIGWNWEPSVLLGLGLLTGAYVAFGRRLRRSQPQASWEGWRRISFHAGTVLVLLALVSPLDSLADHFLFSAHMAQHLFLMLAVPLLWILGIPSWAVPKALPARQVERLAESLAQPALAGTLWVASMWIWHLPRLYDAALASEGLHILEHLTFLAAGLIGWWPVFGPIPASVRGTVQLRQVLYLFVVTLPCTALAAILTLSAHPLYRFYGALPSLFGLTPLADQQLGGLLMWLPGDMILVGGAIAQLSRWMNQAALRTGSNQPLSRRLPNGL